MRRVFLALGWLIALLPASASADDFTGHWTVVTVKDAKVDGGPWSGEIKYPKDMVLEEQNGRLVGHYTDQYGYSDAFELVALVNNGHDLLLVNGGAGTKAAEAYAPIHHVKLVKGQLHAIVTAHDKLFEWTAARE